MKLIDACMPVPELGNEVNVLAGQSMPAFDKQQAYRRPQHGFTLLELLIVITLLAVISSIGLVAYEGSEDEARETTTRFEMGEIRKALLQFRKDTGEFPCRVYREGDYEPDKAAMSQLKFEPLSETPTPADYHGWCRDAVTEQVNNGLNMLHTFAYDDTDTNYTDMLWNPDTRRGWNGPYISREGLEDAWGNRYILLDPELDFRAHYRCKANGSNYAITADSYDCLTADDDGWGLTYTLPSDVARLVSLGPNGRFESNYPADPVNPCEPGGDDIMLCLLR
jgi:prepilin-type N-terminal cleavage/methylation domain-containing protein